MTREPYRPPTMKDRVPNAVFREEFERSHMTLTELAILAGWTKSSHDSRPDTSRVGRLLGYTERDGHIVDQVSYQAGVTLCRALGLDPRDAGV